MNKLTCVTVLIALLTISQKSFAVERTFTATNNIKGQYTILNPELSKSRKKGAIIFLHGTGASSSGYASGLKTFKDIGMGNYLLVAVYAPDNNHNWARGSFSTKSGNLVFLDDLVRRKLIKEHNLNINKIHFVGFSAGAIFLQSDFIPIKGENYRGSFIQMCGGGPILAYQVGMLKKLKNKIKMYIHIGTGDFLYNQTVYGVKDYVKEGLIPIASYPKISGHCNFNMATELKKAFKVLKIN